VAVRSTGRPHTQPAQPTGTINTTDHDARIVRTQGQPAIRGYNAQAAVNENQIIVAAELTVDSPDFGHLEPMVEATIDELVGIGASESPEVVVAEAGYWHKQQMENVVSRGIQVVIPPDSGLRKGARPGWDKGLYAFMRRVLSTEHGQAVYRRRLATIEPVFGQTKFNRRLDRFLRRGRAACRSEWRLIAATHNLLKLHNHRTGQPEPETGLQGPRQLRPSASAATRPPLFPTATTKSRSATPLVVSQACIGKRRLLGDLENAHPACALREKGLRRLPGLGGFRRPIKAASRR
jgi:hypothetical protein